MKKVLLIGDSIRMYYQNRVQELLGEEYEVWGPSENCRFSAYTLNSLRMWLPTCGKPDVVHWNNGLWDTAILYHEDGCFTGINEYTENMRRIYRELKKLGVPIIFATTTPVSPEKCDLTGPMPPAHRNCDIEAYNRAVLEMLNGEVPVNDLYTAMLSHVNEYLLPDLIHPNPDGVELLARQVAEAIRAQCV